MVVCFRMILMGSYTLILLRIHILIWTFILVAMLTLGILHFPATSPFWSFGIRIKSLLISMGSAYIVMSWVLMFGFLLPSLKTMGPFHMTMHSGLITFTKRMFCGIFIRVFLIMPLGLALVVWRFMTLWNPHLHAVGG